MECSFLRGIEQHLSREPLWHLSWLRAICWPALAEAEARGPRVARCRSGRRVVGADGQRGSGRAGNRTRELADPTAHAEMLAIRQACAAQGSERLD